MPGRLGGGGDNCLQSSTSITSSKVAIGWSTAMRDSPKLTRLIEVLME